MDDKQRGDVKQMGKDGCDVIPGSAGVDDICRVNSMQLNLTRSKNSVLDSPCNTPIRSADCNRRKRRVDHQLLQAIRVIEIKFLQLCEGAVICSSSSCPLRCEEIPD